MDGIAIPLIGESSGAPPDMPPGPWFPRIFEPVLPALASLEWITSGISMSFVYELADEPTESARRLSAEADTYHLEMEGRHGHSRSRPGFLNRFCEYLVNDHFNILGVREGRVTLRDFIDRVIRTTAPFEGRLAWLEDIVEVAFFNIDGAWCEFHAKDPALIDAVRAHASDKLAASIRPASFARSMGLVR